MQNEILANLMFITLFCIILYILDTEGGKANCGPNGFCWQIIWAHRNNGVLRPRHMQQV